MKRLIWRLRYTIHGQRKTKWGWRLWWGWSGVEIEAELLGYSPQEAADEEIYAGMT